MEAAGKSIVEGDARVEISCKEERKSSEIKVKEKNKSTGKLWTLKLLAMARSAGFSPWRCSI